MIGSGKGNLKVRDALQAFLEGPAEAFLVELLGLDILKIVERDLDRALEILAAVKESAARLTVQRADRSGLEFLPHPELIGGKGGEISPDFGCSMMLAGLAGGNGRPGLSQMSRAQRDVLSHLPQKLHKNVLARLAASKEDGPGKALRQGILQRASFASRGNDRHCCAAGAKGSPRPKRIRRRMGGVP